MTGLKLKSILKKYEQNRPQDAEDAGKTQTVGNIGMTRMISNQIPELAGISVPESEREDMEDKLIEYMYSVDPEFTRRKILVKKDKKRKKVVSDNLSVYYSGYSLRRRKRPDGTDTLSCKNCIQLTITGHITKVTAETMQSERFQIPEITRLKLRSRKMVIRIWEVWPGHLCVLMAGSLQNPGSLACHHMEV